MRRCRSPSLGTISLLPIWDELYPRTPTPQCVAAAGQPTLHQAQFLLEHVPDLEADREGLAQLYFALVTACAEAALNASNGDRK